MKVQRNSASERRVRSVPLVTGKWREPRYENSRDSRYRTATLYSARGLPEYDNTRPGTVIFGESDGQDNGLRGTSVTGIKRPTNRSISSKELRLVEMTIGGSSDILAAGEAAFFVRHRVAAAGFSKWPLSFENSCKVNRQNGAAQPICACVPFLEHLLFSPLRDRPSRITCRHLFPLGCKVPSPLESFR